MNNMRPTMTDEEMLNDYPRLKLEYTRLHEDYRRLQTEKDKQLLLHNVSQQRELLPDFLYEDDGIIKVGVHGDTAVTDEWNDYLKKLGNCG